MGNKVDATTHATKIEKQNKGVQNEKVITSNITIKR